MALNTDAAANENQILSLFEGAGAVETPTAGVKAWIAYDVAVPGRPVLIKRVPVATKGRATEALALRHPNIVPPRRWLADGANLYVIRDVQRGKNIRQALSAGGGQRPSPELFRRLFLPLISALEAAHARGVTHGGISPENIIIGEDGTPFLCDFATADSKATAHFSAYKGKPSVEGDIKAFSRVLATYLPNSGPFASIAVRGRIEGLLNRCDTLADLRATLETLERLAASAPPSPSAVSPTPETVGEQRMPTLRDIAATDAPTPIIPTSNTQHPIPALEIALLEKTVRVPQGGGGAATLTLKNNGKAPLTIREISTQHAWLNFRPMDKPLVLSGGTEERITLNISAARLTTGEYRSEIRLSAAPDGAGVSDPNFDLLTDLHLIVESPGLPTAAPPEKPPYPTNAPALPGGPGCGVIAAGLLLLFALIAPLALAFAR